jgi:hypothetical protein
MFRLRADALEAMTGGGTTFRVRIVLKHTGPGSNEDMLMPWSAWMTQKKAARKDAARVCLQSLQQTGNMPHDPHYMPPIAVGLQQGGGGGGGHLWGAAPVLVAPATLPQLSAALLGVQAVESVARASAAGTPVAGVARVPRPVSELVSYMDSASDSASDSDIEDNDLWAGLTGLTTPAAAAQSVPPNLGELGESYANEWLQHQDWVRGSSLALLDFFVG